MITVKNIRLLVIWVLLVCAIVFIPNRSTVPDCVPTEPIDLDIDISRLAVYNMRYPVAADLLGHTIPNNSYNT